MRCKNIGGTFPLSHIPAGIGELIPFVPHTSAGWQAVNSSRTQQRISSESPARSTHHRPSWPYNASHCSYFITAGRARTCCHMKESKHTRARAANWNVGVFRKKGGKERGNSLNENLAAAKSLSTLTQHGVWIAVARPWLCPLLLHYYFIDFRREYKSRAAWLP